MDNILIILVLILPLVASLLTALSMLFGKSAGDASEKVIARLNLSAVATSCLIVLYLLFDSYAINNRPDVINPDVINIGEWFSSGSYKINISFMFDKFSLLFAATITLIAVATTKYSINYMHREDGFARYFMIMNLFVSSLLLIALAGNAILTFVGWELAGVCSYLLIGYANQREMASNNATRVIITNRIGDVAFLLALFMSFTVMTSVEWQAINAYQSPSHHLGVSFIALCFFIAAMVKSAQIPFTPWIERALEGPTPSSAIFYGSLMVHVGVFLLIRLEPILVQSHLVMGLIIIIAVLSILYGFLCGLSQSDIKSSLIFATITQVGLMFLWIGLAWFEVAKWHLILHAFWRAFQFLNAPSLIHHVGNNVNKAPSWLTRYRWLYTASMRRFWIEQLGDACISRPVTKLANEVRVFDMRVVIPLVGMPAQARAVSSLQKWESHEADNTIMHEHTVGKGEGVFGKIMQNIASAFHWFEDHLVLKGGGENLIYLLRKLGAFFTKVDLLFSQPRYLVLMIFITLVIIL